MRRARLKMENIHRARFPQLAAVAILLVGSFAPPSVAQQKGQKKFSSADEASGALIAAAKKNDEAALLEILGPEEKDIVTSGDPTQDAEDRANIVQRYEEMHRLVKEPDGTTAIYIGADNWPMPIPLVNKHGTWYFDTATGEIEILLRRIGRNEMSTIRVCEELVAAQKEYFSTQHGVYAQQIFSDEGQHNGLYWKVADGEPQSPIGPLVAAAVAEGYDKGKAGPPTPYRGYLYHVLMSQGEAAPGGAKSYIVDGKMTEGFAFVAYPAVYRSSGVMTFIVGADGVVYQKDLWKKTEKIGKEMKEYNPDSTWQKAKQPEEQTASKQQTK